MSGFFAAGRYWELDSAAQARLAAGSAALIAADIPQGAKEAQMIWAHCAGGADFAGLIARRAARAPLSHLLGYRDFYDHRFIVTPAVLDPRPETEILVGAALAGDFDRVLDLGTGSGCIVLSLLAARAGAMGLGVDISPDALDVAARNGAAMGLGARVHWQQSDWFADVTGRFDLIVANPPYIATAEMAALAPEVRNHEPHLALTDQGDGLGAYRAIAANAGGYLTAGGRLILEIGPTQAAQVRALLVVAGFGAITITPDLDGRARVITAHWA